MLKLDDFFAPLGIANLTIFFAFLASCEIVGFSLAKVFIKKIPDFLRGAIWLLGLGLVVFSYFLSHFFIPYAWPAIGICLAILLIPSLPIYIKEKGWQSLTKFWKGSYLPLLLLIPVLPLIYIKASLPPYIWDEMAYHYISPYTLYYEKAWQFGAGVYGNFPRLLETAFIALFSLTKTYVAARLLQFSIFITALVVAYRFLKESLGILAAILFFALLLFHGENLLLISTWGYIDVGAASLVFIAFICLIGYLLESKIETLVTGVAFLGMAIGVKYSALIPLSASLMITLFLAFKKDFFNKKYFKSYLLSLFLFLILGGYWYIKNFFYTGNPIYPFLSSFIGCKFSRCPEISPAWAYPFTLTHAKDILLQVLGGNKQLIKFFLLSIPLSLFHVSKRVRKIAYFLMTLVVIEVLLAAVSFKYETRFFYHWQFLSALLIVLPTSFVSRYRSLIKNLVGKKKLKGFLKRQNWKVIYPTFTLLLVIFTFFNSKDFIDELYQAESQPERRLEVEYANRKIDIYQWITVVMPRMKEVIFWCEGQEPKTDLMALDPGIIWYDYEGLMRIFMTNCEIKHDKIVDLPAEEVIDSLREEESFFLASLDECKEEVKPTGIRRFQDEVEYLRQVNNDIICNSEEVLPGLYRFSTD